MKRLRRAALGVVLLVSMACTAGAGDSAEANIRALRYPGGYDVRTHENLKDSTFTVSFRARLPYPSETILNFYGREVEKLGWSPIDKAGEGYRAWLCYEDATRPGSHS